LKLLPNYFIITVSKDSTEALLTQLEVAPIQDTGELTAEVGVIVEEIKNRNLSSYEQLAELDIQYV